MNQHLQTILNLIQQAAHLSDDEKMALSKATNNADKDFEITTFKLNRTEKVKRTTAILLEETIEELEQKRKAVEAQNRELEIETALERVRTVAMSMRTPDDLFDICEILYAELQLLGFNELRNAMINIYEDNKDYFLNYDYAPGSGKTVTRMPYNFHPLIDKQVRETKNAGDAFNEFSFTGKELKDFRELRKNNGEQDDPKLDDTTSLHYYFYSIGTGSVGISTYNATTDEKKNVLKRFRNVFDLAYKRYIDITNAEAQAREAQIQLALERVRARTMAMQHSDELKDAAGLLFQQVKILGVPAYSCGYNIWEKEEKEFTAWMSSQDGRGIDPALKIPLNEDPNYIRFNESRQNGEQFYVIEMRGERMQEHYQYLRKTISVFREYFDYAIEAGFTLPETQIHHLANFSHGNLMFITLEPCPEFHDIFKRVAKVFEQTYTRFLDLQKAEAQAREAKIEAALERVRSKTMAMHNSEDVGETVATLFDELVKLGVHTNRCGILINSEDRMQSEVWTAKSNPTGKASLIIGLLDLTMHPLLEGIYHAWKSKKSVFIYPMIGDDLKAYYQAINDTKYYPTLFDLDALPSKEFHTDFFFAEGSIFAFTAELLVEEASTIFKRFAGVFGQTYRRFLDLQKAEAQAREAKIEAALERTRTQSMIMQHSNELDDTLRVFHEQVISLGNPSAFSFLWLPDEEKDRHIFWAAWGEDKNGSAVFNSKSINYPLDRNEPATAQCLIDWKSNEPVYSYHVPPTGVENYFAAWSELIDGVEQLKPEYFSSGLYYVEAFMKYGCFGVMAATDLKEDEKKILGRFAVEFERTYTRFLDLQKAEAQAREAHIEAALEKVRSRSLAMHKSDELQDVVNAVFERLKALDLDMNVASIFTFKEGSKDWEQWVASADTDYSTYFHIPYTDNTIFNDLEDAKEKGKAFYTVTYPYEQKNGWFNYAFLNTEYKRIPEARKKFLLESEFYHVAFALTKHTGLQLCKYSGNIFSENDHGIVKRFAKVFEQAYTRFLDLQKSEAQAREATIEAALERVRSRTMAMQKSDELAETAAVLFRQLILLGIEPNRLYIGIIKDADGHIEFWVTDEDGSKVSTQFTGDTNRNASMKKMYDAWKAEHKSLTIDMQGKELENYFNYLSEDLNVPFKKGLSQKRRIQSIAFFGKGFIGIASPDEQPEETTLLLERFAAVFNLTYTRFNDLKVAEAHAIQAEEDLIKLQTEKKRAEDALTELRATQTQLIQSEKMASLGELTAGIAHEIQNPLNFVNNFSEVSNELIDEMNAELDKGDIEEAKAIAHDIKQNLEKINHHGKRADGIVKGMLQHSRTSAGQMELTDINVLADEYLRLAYHGLRAKNKSFNATLQTDFDTTIGKINIGPQDIGRVILNLINNAFYAVAEKKKLNAENYEPTVWTSTKKTADAILIIVRDNGNGIPQKIADKIFQPFFTTKPTGQGTGLGLSLSYDIVKAHGGEIKVETKEGEETKFIIQLPIG